MIVGAAYIRIILLCLSYNLAVSGAGFNDGFSANSVQKERSYDAIEFSNVGYSGSYNVVKKLSDIYSDECSCEINKGAGSFSGTNAPLNEELSVHLRGPLILENFAYYVSKDYSYGSDSSQNWTRLAYYDSATSTASNVTFLTNAGKNSSCLGKALTYADSDGVSKADKSTVLGEDTLVNSDEEYSIFSSIECDSSGVNKDCGVYREGIPAYHGFYGTTKMFLFKFKMPNETSSDDSLEFFNMPAIWLLNSHIPRTSQYATNANCSCWSSGCGEFDIFEVANTTQYERLYATIHDYQGTGNIQDGIKAKAYFDRDLENSMVGGIVFDSDGNLHAFLSNSTTFDDTIQGSDVDDWLSSDSSVFTQTLSSISSASTSSKSSKSKGGSPPNIEVTVTGRIFWFLFSIVFLFV